VLVGATAIGLTEHVGVLRGLIEGRVRLGPWKDACCRIPSASWRPTRAGAGCRVTGQARVRVALKLYASLADYLPPEARRAHRLELELAAGTTVADVIAQQSLPLKLCTWCW